MSEQTELTEQQTQAVLALAADIRDVDGGHSLGAAELAEKLIERGWHPTTAETERLRGECERLTRERDAMLAELQRIATFHVGTTYPVPEGEPPLWVQNRSVIGRCEDDARKANELLRRAKETLIDADDDIGEWCQLAQRQHDELLPVGHHPLAPTPGGIAKSRNMQKRIRAALKAIHEAFTN